MYKKIRHNLIIKNILSIFFLKNSLVESCKLTNIYYICTMKVDISNLLTIKNFAKKEDVSPAYIYKLIKEGKMQPENKI